MKSIFIRNFLSTALIICFCFIIVVTCALIIGRSFVIDSYSTSMQNAAKETAGLVSVCVAEKELDDWEFRMFLSAVSGSSGNTLMITDADGVIVNCSDTPASCTHLTCKLPDSLLLESDTGSFLSEGTLDGLLSEYSLYAAAPIQDDNGNVFGYVVVAGDLNHVYGEWNPLLLISAFVIGGVIVVALIAAYAFTKMLAKPLDEMAAASRKFALGDYSVRVKQWEDPSDEIGSLIEAFNTMADAIEKNETTRSEFIANVSHELRTPMTTIAGFADGILDGTISPENQEKYLRSIRDETRRLARLVREMLDASRAQAKTEETINWAVFDISELTVQTLLSFETRAMEKQLDVDPQFPDDRLMVKADKDAINRVIYNLLDNAVKFAKAESCITVRVYKESGKAYVSVKDEGETIPAEDIPLIFDRFHKSDRSRSLDKDGVGLGLYLVKSIINSHGESIVVRSEDGVTEFVFSLPLA